MAVLFAASPKPPQDSPIFQGSWTATVGQAKTFRGTWSAQAAPRNPNALRGSWTLVNDSSDIILQGTWSAQKTARGWQGAWTAQPAGGGSLSGSWDADLAGFAGRTLVDMLQRTTEKQVAGSWRSGRYQGYWWLTGSAREAPHR